MGSSKLLAIFPLLSTVYLQKLVLSIPKLTAKHNQLEMRCLQDFKVLEHLWDLQDFCPLVVQEAAVTRCEVLLKQSALSTESVCGQEGSSK